jgi:hypothetical protein
MPYHYPGCVSEVSMSVQSKVLDELRKARAAVTEVLRHAEKAAPHVADALNALDRLERLLETASAKATPEPRRGARSKPKTYRVEGRPGQEALCEYRADDPDRPFRCPKATYDALALVMADTPKPARFDDIAKRLKKQLGELPALYQLRVALRFWTTPEVGLVERVRARYREHTRG